MLHIRYYSSYSDHNSSTNEEISGGRGSVMMLYPVVVRLLVLHPCRAGTAPEQSTRIFAGPGLQFPCVECRNVFGTSHGGRLQPSTCSDDLECGCQPRMSGFIVWYHHFKRKSSVALPDGCRSVETHCGVRSFKLRGGEILHPAQYDPR